MLGVTLSDLGRVYKAIIDYSKAIEINPKDDGAYINKGYTVSIF